MHCDGSSAVLGIQNETSYSVLLGYSALAATLGSATNATSFRDRRDYLTSYNVSEAVGDVNNDGIPDLVLCGGSGALVEFGNGDGTFTTGPEYLTGFVVYTPILADINGDSASGPIRLKSSPRICMAKAPRLVCPTSSLPTVPVSCSYS